MAGKINERLQDLLASGQGIGMNMATGQSFPRAVAGVAKDAALTKVIGPATGALGIFLTVSRTLATIIRQTDMWGRGMERMRSLEQIESGFATILKSAALAKERMRELSQFSINSPFKVDDVMQAARSLELLTKGAYASKAALAEVGDAAAASNQSIGETAFVVGKLYNFLQNGRSVQNLAFHLQNMGVISGELQEKLELMQSSGAGFSQMWAEVQKELGRAKGGMADNMKSLDGLQQRLQNVRDAMAANYGESFVEQEKNAIYATIKATEALSPVLKLIGRDVSTVTGVWRGWTAELKGSVFETLGVSGALEKLWKGFTIAGGGVMAAAGVGVSKFVGSIVEGGSNLSGLKKAGRETAVAKSLSARAENQKAQAGALRDQAFGALASGAYLEAGQIGIQSAAQRGLAWVSGVRAESAGAARLAALGAGLTAARAARAKGLTGAGEFGRARAGGYGAGALVLEAAAAQAVQMAMMKAATATAAKATATTLLGRAVSGTTKMLSGLILSLGRGVMALGPWGWVAAAVGVSLTVLARKMIGMNDAAKAMEAMGKAAADADRALREQVKNISTVEDRAAALAKAYERLAEVQGQIAKTDSGDKDKRLFLENEEKAAKRQIKYVENMDVSRLGKNKQQIEVGGQLRYFEQYEAPRMELVAAEGLASPAGRFAAAQKDLERVRKNRAEVAVMDQAAKTFAGTAEGRELDSLQQQRASILGEDGPNVEYTQVSDRLNELQQKRNDAYAEATLSFGKSGKGDDRLTSDWNAGMEAEYQKLTERQNKLKALMGDGNKEELQKYLTKRAEALDPRIKQLQMLSPEPGVSASLRAEEAFKKGDLAGADAIKEQAIAATSLRQAYGGAAGASEEQRAEQKRAAAEIELKAYRNALELERALLDEKEVGWAAEKRANDARVEAARRDLELEKEKAALLKKMGVEDSGGEEEARRKLAVATRERAVSEAQHKETRRQAEAPLKELEARNAIEVAMLNGDAGQASYLQGEEKRRQLTERLYNARVQGIQSGLGGDEAVGIERRKIEAEQQSEFLAQYRAEQGKALATETDPWKRSLIEKGLAFRNRIGELVTGGMEANQARSTAEKEFGGYSSDLSAADSAAGFFLGGRGNVDSRLAVDMANFNANMVSPSLTAEEQAKKSSSLTDVLKALDQKIKDASSVLVMKEGSR